MRMPAVELGTPVGLTRGFTRILRAARGAISPLWLALLALALLAVLLSAVPGALTVRSDAVSARIRLEQELIRAHDQLSIPSYLLQPVADGERRVRTSAGPLDAGGEAAAASYTRLQRQLQTIEATSDAALRDRANADLQAFTLLLNTAQSLPGTDKYQRRLDGALRRITSANTTADYADLDADLTTQIAALRAMTPAYQKLQALATRLRGRELLGTPSALGAAAYSQDVRAFQNAGAASDYTRLGRVIDGQMMQLRAELAAALPTRAPAVLRTLQSHIATLRALGEDVSAFQPAVSQLARALASASAPADVAALAGAMDEQGDALVLPLARAQAYQDLAAFQRLLATAQRIPIISPYDGRRYPSAAEYATEEPGYGGLGAVESELDGALSADDYQRADNDVRQLTLLLQTMLDNMRDRTASGLPHAADLRLLQHYGLSAGKVIVISLREQTARFYDHGVLVKWSYVTTGRPERPSPPGLHHATEKLSPTTFLSNESRDSPFWFAPTPVKYAIAYQQGGFFLHDGWWRKAFGPGTNLPHHEPNAFNGGSHGCINFPPAVMPWVYAWTSLGTPVLVY